MASRSQMRLQQLTGSAVDIKSEVAQYIAPSTAAALTGSDLQDVLGAMAAAIQRIHGENSSEVFNQAEGQFDTSKFDVNSAGVVSLDGTALNIGLALALPVNLDATSYDLDASAAIEMDAGSASHLKTSGGAITFDGAAGVDLQFGASSKLEVASAEVTLKTDLLPDSDSSHALGSNAESWVEVHSHAYYGTGSFASTLVADLNDGRVVLAGAGGELEDSANLTFDGSKFGVTGSIHVDASTIDIDASAAIAIDGGAAINVTAVGAFDIEGGATSEITTTNGEIHIKSAEKLYMDPASTSYDIDLGTVRANQVNIGRTGQLTDIKGQLSVDEAAVFDSNVTVAGDLTVQGNTTTLDTANLLVEDPLIKLNKGDTTSPARDQGLVFSRGDGSSADQDNKAMIWDESASEFAFIASATEDATTSGNVVIDSYANLQIGNLSAVDITLTGDISARTGSFQHLDVSADADLLGESRISDAVIATAKVSDLTSGRIVLAGTGGELQDNANFTYNADDIMVGGAGAVVLSTLDDSVEADIFKIVDSDAQIQISARYGGNALHISDVSDAIALNAGNGFIGFENSNTMELGLDMGTSDQAMFIFNDNTDALAFISDDGSGNQSLRVQTALPLEFRDADLSIRSSVNGQLDIAADVELEIAAPLIDMNGDAKISGDLYLDGSNKELRFYEGANYVGFVSPALSADQIWVLPEADASVADSSLVSDAAGVLSWKAPSQENSKKYIIEDGAVTANTSLSTTVNLSAVTAARAVHVVDVFVNGQLMKPDLTAGSLSTYTGNVASTADYKLDFATSVSAGDASTIKFGFDLEADDIVTVIMRA